MPEIATRLPFQKIQEIIDRYDLCNVTYGFGSARTKWSFLGNWPSCTHSMRLPVREPEGTVGTAQSTVRMTSNHDGVWQTLVSHGHSETYRFSYVIGSGTHGSGYIVSLANQLFQSPVVYYRRKSAYGLAPGYESETDPDFTRPIKPGCVFCHAGSFVPVSGTINGYDAQPFRHLAIDCTRCHGPVAVHLANPGPSTIVNPATLNPASRDKVCEQCHLKGVARVLNPGKDFTDFAVGQPREKTFTIYQYSTPPGEQPPFNLISHSEQLALSRCKRISGDRVWCGTCHNPHSEPADAVPTIAQNAWAATLVRTLPRVIPHGTATVSAAICQFSESAIAFELAARCDPASSSTEANLGSAYAASGKNGEAESHLERALDLDPLNLGAAEQLMGLYEKSGETGKLETIRNKMSGFFP